MLSHGCPRRASTRRGLGRWTTNASYDGRPRTPRVAVRGRGGRAARARPGYRGAPQVVVFRTGADSAMSSSTLFVAGFLRTKNTMSRTPMNSTAAMIIRPWV